MTVKEDRDSFLELYRETLGKRQANVLARPTLRYIVWGQHVENQGPGVPIRVAVSAREAAQVAANAEGGFSRVWTETVQVLETVMTKAGA
jgi:hypothetical protein